jgi:hypothetical protein
MANSLFAALPILRRPRAARPLADPSRTEAGGLFAVDRQHADRINM